MRPLISTVNSIKLCDVPETENFVHNVKTRIDTFSLSKNNNSNSSKKRSADKITAKLKSISLHQEAELEEKGKTLQSFQLPKLGSSVSICTGFEGIYRRGYLNQTEEHKNNSQCYKAKGSLRVHCSIKIV